MNRKTLRTAIRRSPLLAVALIVVFAGTVLATPPRDFTAAPLARGTVSESVHFNTGEVKFQTKGPVDLATNMVTIAPGGSSGWHFHPGVTLVTVASGSVIRYDAHCTPTVFAAGSAFVEAGDHPLLVVNVGATPAVNIVTFMVPAGTLALRIDSPNPGCPQD
jgi:quercetin dioxygenase-like cupin family protein